MAKRLVIAVTGVPGTGKTDFSNRLARKLGVVPIEVNDIVKRRKLYSGKDRGGAMIVKMGALRREVAGIIGGRASALVIVGHLLADLDLRYDVCIVTRARLPDLARRLSKRGYGREKIRENLFAEALDYCGVKAAARSRELYEVRTGGEKSALVRYVDSIANGRKAEKPKSAGTGSMKELFSLIKRKGVNI